MEKLIVHLVATFLRFLLYFFASWWGIAIGYLLVGMLIAGCYARMSDFRGTGRFGLRLFSTKKANHFLSFSEYEFVFLWLPIHIVASFIWILKKVRACADWFVSGFRQRI